MILRLTIHDVKISIRAPKAYANVLVWIQSDFQAFAVKDHAARPEIRLCVAPRFSFSAPKWPWLRTSYSASGGWRTKRIAVDPSHAIVLRGRDRYFACVKGEDPSRLYEMLDRLLLSSIGEFLDRRGIHRLHAFSFQYLDKTVAVTGRSGIGKSYLATLANEDPECEIFSDEVLLIQGEQLLPFPIALSADPSFKTLAGHMVQRKDGPKKLRIPLAHPVLKNQESLSLLIFPRPSRTSSFRLSAAGGLEKLGFLFSAGLGLGQMQMAEFTLRFDLIFWLPRIFISRLWTAVKILRNARCVSLEIPRPTKWADLRQNLFLGEGAHEKGADLLPPVHQKPARPDRGAKPGCTRAEFVPPNDL
jgi:hypothetical protein